ncbi:ABC transporter ATP-binding protein [Aquimarina hainanensis]|uniref:ABC transporter ATP-binding protein n=1 Tax=Aquimarina hainanensis TaxID=1578017 RepID=A0ABW5N6I2_9FLAO
MNTLNIHNVSLVYSNGYQALNALTIEIKNGIFGLLGPNGAGKSSLMKAIVGLQKPSEGTITFNNQDIVENPIEIQKHLGFLPQYFGVYPKISAYNLLEHLAKLKGINHPQKRKKQIITLLEKVNLLDAKDKAVHTFSGGMKQRFGVAQALLGSPKIVIVDEPTAGLDPEERNRFNTLLSDLSEDIIIILSTHLVEDVRNLCSTMGIMKRGKLIVQGKPKDFIKQLQGKLWSKETEKNDISAIETNYKVINTQLVERVMNVTVVADEQPDSFQAINPTLEHVYFNYLS